MSLSLYSLIDVFDRALIITNKTVCLLKVHWEERYQSTPPGSVLGLKDQHTL